MSGVYWWGGQQAADGGTLYAPGARAQLHLPPFAAALFTLAAYGPEGDLAAVITVRASARWRCCALLGLERAAGVRRRPETVFAVTALSLPTWPVAYTAAPGESSLMPLPAGRHRPAPPLRRLLVAGIATGLAAGSSQPR
jgi:hypothetical protein